MQLAAVKQSSRSRIGCRLAARHRVFENRDVHGPLCAPIGVLRRRNTGRVLC